MGKIIKIIGIIAILCALGFLIFKNAGQQQEIEQLIKLNNERSIINDSLKLNEQDLKIKFDSIEKKSIISDSLIVSLEERIFLDKDKPCEHRLELEKVYSAQLKSSLADCQEAKAIQTNRISNLSTINVNNEVVLSECMTQINVVQEDDKKRKFMRWVERAGWVALIVLVAL